jgi:hypothetical protein
LISRTFLFYTNICTDIVGIIIGYIKVKRLEWAGYLIETLRKYLTPDQKEQGKWEDQN